MPAMGVKILSNGTTPATAKYLNTSRHIDPALGATGALGCAVLLGDSMIGTLSGTGGGVTKWEAQPGASTTGVVFVSRFHNCDVSTGDPNCQ
jgi:hypothetical protein